MLDVSRDLRLDQPGWIDTLKPEPNRKSRNTSELQPFPQLHSMFSLDTNLVDKYTERTKLSSEHRSLVRAR